MPGTPGGGGKCPIFGAPVGRSAQSVGQKTSPGGGGGGGGPLPHRPSPAPTRTPGRGRRHRIRVTYVLERAAPTARLNPAPPIARPGAAGPPRNGTRWRTTCLTRQPRDVQVPLTD